MEIGFVGLGRMGKHMVLRLLENDHRVVVWNRTRSKVEEVQKDGAVGADDVDDLISTLKPPRIVWLMLPAGDVTEQHIGKIVPLLGEGDILIDGGNANFHDSIRRHDELKKKGIRFMDIGVSGGLVAAKKGYCMMAGGEREAFDHIYPLLESMCVTDGFAYMGKGGSGHYVKMVHNAVEYGMMQAIAEGFDLLKNGRFDLDLPAISHVWNNGSIVRSFLMEMVESALAKDAELSYLKPYVEDSGEGRWAAIEAMEQKVPFTVNNHALYARFISRDQDSLAFKMLAAMRKEFGGHAFR